MDERAALHMVAERLDIDGDDAAVIGETVVAVDMLHEAADFPPGISPYTVGWRTTAVTLSDQAAMGATPIATLAVYGAPRFEREDLTAFLDGAVDASESVGATYVGGDLDQVDERTTVGVSVGTTDRPVWRSGAHPGDVVVVTGSLGRGALAYELFNEGEPERANELYRFSPRVDAGRTLGSVATAMIDSSDGLIRSLYHVAESSACGFAIERESLPINDHLASAISDDETLLEYAIAWGEDFELVATLPRDDFDRIQPRLPVPVTPIGRVTGEGVTMDGEPVSDRGHTHGSR